MCDFESFQVLLLMATAIDAPILRPLPDTTVDTLPMELRTRQQCVAEITEMIHVRFLTIFRASSIVLNLFWGKVVDLVVSCI